MMNNNLNYKIIPLFNSSKVPVTSAGTSESIHNNGYDIFTLEIEGNAKGRLEGCTNIIKPNGEPRTDSECAWATLGYVNMKDFSIGESFNGAGHYAFGINGMSRIRVVLTSVTGEAIVVGIMEA